MLNRHQLRTVLQIIPDEKITSFVGISPIVYRIAVAGQFHASLSNLDAADFTFPMPIIASIRTFFRMSGIG
jgi:predicted lipase